MENMQACRHVYADHIQLIFQHNSCYILGFSDVRTIFFVIWILMNFIFGLIISIILLHGAQEVTTENLIYFRTHTMLLFSQSQIILRYLIYRETCLKSKLGFTPPSPFTYYGFLFTLIGFVTQKTQWTLWCLDLWLICWEGCVYGLFLVLLKSLELNLLAIELDIKTYYCHFIKYKKY